MEADKLKIKFTKTFEKTFPDNNCGGVYFCKDQSNIFIDI